MTERARDITETNQEPGRDTPPREQDFTPPDQASDPHTAEDETTDSIRQKATKNKSRLIGLSFLIFAGIAFIAWFLLTVAPGILSNKYVQYGTAITVFAILVYRAGGKRWLNIIQHHTLMIESRPNGPKVWIMEYDRARNTGKPFKGVSLWRGVKDNYSVEDLGGKHAQHIAKYGGDPEDDAVIKYPESTKVAETWFATVAVCLTRGHKPTGGRQDIHLIARPAKRGHLEDLKEFRRALEERDRLLEEKKDELQAIRAERDTYKALFEEKRDGIRQEIQEDMLIAHDARRPRESRQQNQHQQPRDEQTAMQHLKSISENPKYGDS